MSLTPEEIELIKWLHESERFVSRNSELMELIINRDKPVPVGENEERDDNSGDAARLLVLGCVLFCLIIATIVIVKVL